MDEAHSHGDGSLCYSKSTSLNVNITPKPLIETSTYLSTPRPSQVDTENQTSHHITWFDTRGAFHTMSYLIPLCLRKGSLGTFKSFAQVPSAWTPQGQCPLHLGRWPPMPTPVLLADMASLWRRFPALLPSRVESLHCRRKLLGVSSHFSESMMSMDRAFPTVSLFF